MSANFDVSRMVRKQYYLSTEHVARIHAIREEIGARSDAEVIRSAIDAFDPRAVGGDNLRAAAQAVEMLLAQLETLNAGIADTLARSESARARVEDPAWVESIRARARAEAEHNPALVDGVAALIGA